MRLRPHIVALEQPAELLGGEGNHLFLQQSRPVKLLPTLDHLVPDGEAVTIPVQNLDGIESTADEQEQRATEYVLLYHLTRQRRQAIASASHIHGLRSEEHTSELQS